MKKELTAFLISMLPLVEIRGGLPVALATGISPVAAILITGVGNMIPIPFILLFIRPVFAYLKKHGKIGEIITKIEKRALSKSGDISKRNIIGLIIFVGIPLPGTGAWTGALIAALLDMRIKYAFPAIALGVLIAAVIMTIISICGISFLQWMV